MIAFVLTSQDDISIPHFVRGCEIVCIDVTEVQLVAEVWKHIAEPSPYIVCSNKVTLAERCPDDWLQKLDECLAANPDSLKVALSIEGSEEARKANCTLAIYRPHTHWQGTAAILLPPPYVCRGNGGKFTEIPVVRNIPWVPFDPTIARESVNAPKADMGAGCSSREAEPFERRICELCGRKGEEVPIYRCTKYDCECAPSRYQQIAAGITLIRNCFDCYVDGNSTHTTRT